MLILADFTGKGVDTPHRQKESNHPYAGNLLS